MPDAEEIQPPPDRPTDPAMVPALILTQADMRELDALLGEVPMKYGVPLAGFIQQRLLRQRGPQPP